MAGTNPTPRRSEPKPCWGPLWDNPNQRLTFRKAGGPVGSGFESTSRLGGSHTPSRHGLFTLLKSGVAYRGCSTRMAEGRPRRVRRGIRANRAHNGPPGCSEACRGPGTSPVPSTTGLSRGEGSENQPPPKKKLPDFRIPCACLHSFPPFPPPKRGLWAVSYSHLTLPTNREV